MNKDLNDLDIIIKGCVLNDRVSQEKLYNLYSKRMISLVRKYINDEGKAEEIMHNGFLRAYKNINQYQYQGSFEGWLRRVVFHAVADYVKKEKKHDRVLLKEKDSVIHKDHGDNMYYNQLLHLIERLPNKSKKVFNMNVMEGMTHREIGENLGISEGTSKWHLSEAREMLQKHIVKMQLHLTM
jgi:RNA polymerase sigma factor (sigma-70 family)